MKIACFQYLPACGAKRALYNFALELKRNKHSLDFYSFDTFLDQHMNIADFADHTYSYPLKPFKRAYNIKPYFLEIYWNACKKYRYFQYLEKQYQKIAQDIDAKNYDVVFVHNCYYTQTPFLLKHLKSTSVYYAHEPLRSIYDPFALNVNAPQESISSSFLKQMTSRLQNSGMIFEKNILKKIDHENFLSADHVLTNSYFTRECVFKAYGVHSRTCYPGVDIDYFKPLNLPKKNIIITVGGIEALKQHDFVIRSLAKIPESKRPELVIVGPWSVGSYVDTITQLARTNNIQLTIKKLITDEELLKTYNEAKMLIYPPLMEPLGLVPLEAMASGTPVIGVKEGGIRETIIDGQTGYLIDRDEEQCAQTILKILEDQMTTEKITTQAREYVCREWHWKICTQRLEQLFKNFIKEKS